MARKFAVGVECMGLNIIVLRLHEKHLLPSNNMEIYVEIKYQENSALFMSVLLFEGDKF